MRMRRNLFLGIASIVAIAVALTVLTYRNLSATNRSLTNLYEIQSVILADLKELRANQSADRQDALALMLDPDPLQQRVRLRALELRAAQTDACVERLGRRLQEFPSAYGRLQSVVALRRLFVEARDQRLVPLILAGKQEEAKELALGIQRQRSEQINDALEELGNDVNTSFQQRLSAMRRSTTGMLYLLVGLSGIGLTLSTAILLFVHKTARRLEEAETGLRLRNAEHVSHLRFLESLEKVDRAIRKAESLEVMMSGVLDSALSIFGSDRAWLLYPCDPCADSFRVPMERTNPGYPGALAMGRELPVTAEVREAFEAALGECDPLVFDTRSGRSLPQELARQFQVQSQIMVTLYPKRGNPWLFGMHQCSHLRIWEERDVALFKEISRRIADGLSSLLFLREMQDSREKLRATLASMDDLVFALDKDGRVIDYFHPPDQPDPNGWSATPLGKTLREALPHESAKPLEEAMDAVIRSGEVQQVEYPVALGGGVRWFSAKASARKDSAGNFAGVTIVASDVSEIKLAQDGLRKLSQELEERVRQRTSELEAANYELVQLADRLETAYQSLRQETEERLKMMEELGEKDRMLIQQSHLAAMGELMSSIAHHWRQPLNVLGLIVQEMSIGHGAMPSEYLKENSAKAMQVINGLSRTINDFSYFFRSSGEKGLFRVKDLLVKATALLEAAMRDEHVQLELEVEDEDAVIEGYQREYFQVLLNILTNAKDVFRERKVAAPRLVVRQFRERGHIVVTIADNAGGIPEAVMQRIFEPYFTTKEPDKRAGIGLYMAKIVIEKNMNGALTIRNTSDGAEFRIEV